jgi:hypothetical protein
VWYLTESRLPDECVKLKPIYDGPFVVVKRLSKLDYDIQFDATGRHKVVHHDKLKPYQGNRHIPWARSALRKASKNMI